MVRFHGGLATNDTGHSLDRFTQFAPPHFILDFQAKFRLRSFKLASLNIGSRNVKNHSGLRVFQLTTEATVDHAAAYFVFAGKGEGTGCFLLEDNIPKFPHITCKAVVIEDTKNYPGIVLHDVAMFPVQHTTNAGPAEGMGLGPLQEFLPNEALNNLNDRCVKQQADMGPRFHLTTFQLFGHNYLVIEVYGSANVSP